MPRCGIARRRAARPYSGAAANKSSTELSRFATPSKFFQRDYSFRHERPHFILKCAVDRTRLSRGVLQMQQFNTLQQIVQPKGCNSKMACEPRGAIRTGNVRGLRASSSTPPLDVNTPPPPSNSRQTALPAAHGRGSPRPALGLEVLVDMRRAPALRREKGTRATQRTLQPLREQRAARLSRAGVPSAFRKPTASSSCRRRPLRRSKVSILGEIRNLPCARRSETQQRH